MDGTVEEQLDAEQLRAIAEQRVGKTLRGVGEVVDLAGVGGMGAVYRAETADGESVAVKMMHEHIKSNDRLRTRFLREAKILDRVDHRNAVQVYGTGEAETGEQYFAMEYLEGEEVATILQYSGPFAPADALDLGEQALDGLHAYHEADVLHRDLKPSNLFVTTNGTVKLLDFSVARYRETDRTPTQEGTMLGTPAYMAPEQSLGHQNRIDERTDVFGLGAVLYEVLSGQTVYDIDSARTALVQAAMAQTAPLQRHAPDVPDEVAAIVDRAVSRDREDRFQSAAAMRDAIRELRGTEPERAPDDSRPPGDPPSIVVDAEQLEDLLDDRDDRPAAAEESVDITPRLMEALRSIRSRPDDEEFRRHVGQLSRAFRSESKAEQAGVRWSVGPYWFETDTGETYEFGDQLEDIPRRLQDVGFYRLAIDGTVTDEELYEFLEWLALTSQAPLAPEDDLATEFRALDFQSIGAGILENFRWEERGAIRESIIRRHRDRQRQVVDYLCGPKGLWAGLEVRASTDDIDDGTGLPRKVESRAGDFLRRPKGVLSFEAASSLKDATELASDDWDRPLAPLLAGVWERRAEVDSRADVVVRDLVQFYLDDDAPRDAVEWIVRTVQALDTPAAGRGLIARALEPPNFERLVRAIDETVVDDERREKYGDILRRFADELPSSHLDQISGQQDAPSELIRRILERGRDPRASLDEGDLDPGVAATDVGHRTPSEQPFGRNGDSKPVDLHRAFAGELFRLVRQTTGTDQDTDVEEVARTFQRRLQKLFSIGSAQFSLLFADSQIFINGIPLDASIESYSALADVRELLDRAGCNEIVLRDGLTGEGVAAFIELLRRLAANNLDGAPPFEPEPGVSVRATDPSESFGLVDPLVGERPLEARIGRYYASCATTLEQYLRAPVSEKPEWFRDLHRMSQAWTRLCARSRASTLAVVGMELDEHSTATRVLDSAILAILMARRLTGDLRRLRGLAYAGLCSIPSDNRGSAVEAAAVQPWDDAVELAAALLTHAQTDDDSLWRTIVTYETSRLEFGGRIGHLDYGDDQSPKIESILLLTARHFIGLFSETAKDGEAARKVVEQLSSENVLRVETYLLHLLADTLCLFTRGMRVETSTGWRGVVVESGDRLTELHLPVVRLQANPEGKSISSRDVDLAERMRETDEFGYVTRRTDGPASEGGAAIRDTMSESLRRQ